MTHNNLITHPAVVPGDSTDKVPRPVKKRKRSRFRQLSLEFFSIVLRARFYFLAGGHALVFAASFVIAFLLRFDFAVPAHEWRYFGPAMLVVVAIKLVFFYAFRSFHGWWRYIAFSDLQALGKATVISLLATAVIDYFLIPFQIPRAVLIVDALITFFAIGTIRSSWRLLHEEVRPWFSKSQRRKTLLVGTSDAVIRLGHQLRSLPQLGYETIGLLSVNQLDNPSWYSGFPVLGSFHSIEFVFSCYHIDEILVPAGELTGSQMRYLSEVAESNHLKLRVLPRVEDLFSGSRKMPVRDVDINDLLGREPVQLDNSAISKIVTGQVVLVTGAGGSIGSEICRQVLLFKPAKLVLLGRGENRIFEIERELRPRLSETELEAVIADINDLPRLRSVFELHSPDVVFHAAAHKHVPLMEANVSEAIRNNILGTKNVADCAVEFETDRFVLISSDKAVNPTSVMGATKHMAERYSLSLMDANSPTRFVVVRFGNVLGSNGSVIPIFKSQIAAGGPITITDERMKRFFMSIPEAAQLVLQAGAQGKGGEIFVLDMGEPVLVVDLARDLIRLSGLAPDAIDIQFTGMRPGEKLYEELYFDEESALATDHAKIFAAYHRPFPHGDVIRSINELSDALESEAGQQKRKREKEEKRKKKKKKAAENWTRKLNHWTPILRGWINHFRRIALWLLLKRWFCHTSLGEAILGEPSSKRP